MIPELAPDRWWERWGRRERRVRMEVWRVPTAEIPSGTEARVRWRQAQWERVDRWVGDASSRGCAVGAAQGDA